MAYMVFLGNFALPIPPSSITTSVRNKNSTMDLIDGTEINILKKGGLTEFGFEFLLPHQRYPFVPRENEMISEAVNALFAGKNVYDNASKLWENRANLANEFSSVDSVLDSLQSGSLGTAMEITTSSMAAVSSVAGMMGSEMFQSAKTGFLLGQLEYLKQSQDAFYFIVARKGEGLTDFNLPFTCTAVSLEDYKIKEDAEAYGMDICVEVSLKQYKEYSTKFVEIKEVKTATNPQQPNLLTTATAKVEEVCKRAGMCAQDAVQHAQKQATSLSNSVKSTFEKVMSGIDFGGGS